MSTHVYTVVGAKVATAVIEQRVSSFRAEAAANGLYVVDVPKQNASYICTRSHSFEIDGERLRNYGPLVVYQDSNWDKDKVRHFLEPLDLWLDGIFGVWVFAVV